GKGQARLRVDQRPAQKAEIAAALLRRGDDRLPRQAAILAIAFIRTKHERLVVNDRSPERRAELVEFERRRFGGREEVLRLEPVAAQELPAGPVPFVRAGLGDDVDDRSGVAAEL